MRTRLRSVSTNGGFLVNAKTEFADGLTCIIGARGTCKSTLVETIRFLFDHDRDQVARLTESAPEAKGLIAATLGAATASAVVVDVGHGADTLYTLEREVSEETRIFVDGVREHADRAILSGIEIFSQGDLQRMAKGDSHEMRLALIDRPNRPRVADLQKRRLDLVRELSQIGEQLRPIQAQIATLRQEVAQLDGFRSQLADARTSAPAATPELDSERLAYEQRQHLVEELRRLESHRATMAAEILAALKPARDAQTIVERLAASGDSLPEVKDAVDVVSDAVSTLGAAVSRLSAASLSAGTKRLAQRFEDESQRYYELRREQQDVNESLKQQQALQRQVDHLTRQSRSLDELASKDSVLRDQRRQARARLAEVEDELFNLRIAEIDVINALHSGSIHLSLSSTTATNEYAAAVFKCLQGSRIRSQDEVARSIADRIPPAALVDIVEAGDAQQLATSLGRDLGQMNRVVSHLADHPELYVLESMLRGATLDITMYDHGEPKPVESLSEGQRATALLPIILRDLPWPLLFDQPEDDLDNQFIFDSLIKIVRTLKVQRQIIFVTHNANIPVLGEADRVIVMEMKTPTQAALPRVGTVDERKQDILNLLEGGAAAFSAREERYHELLADR